MQPGSRSRVTVGGAAAIAIAVAVMSLSACGSDTSPSRVAGPPSTLAGTWAIAKLAPGDDLTTDTIFTKLAPLHVVVRFNDAPMAGVAVMWTISDQSAATAFMVATTTTTTTGPDGIASLDFAFGSKAGLYVVQATLPQRPDVVPVQFSGTALPGHATGIHVVSGAGQNDTASAQLRNALVVRVTDSYDNGVPGMSVDWTVTAGGGSVSSVLTTTIAPDGSSSVQYTLGRAVGANLVTASLHDSEDTVTFQANASAANPTKLTMVSGNNQTAVVNHSLGADFVVMVTDSYANPAPGVAIAWSIIAGGGSLSASKVTSGQDGIGATRSTLGPVNITQSVSASLTAWPKVPAVTFSSLGTAPPNQPPLPPPPPPPPPSTLTIVSGDGQTGDPGTTLSAPIVVIAADATNHPLPNRAVTFSVSSGGGSVSPPSAVTDDQGLAQATWKLGATVGPQTLSVSAPSVTTTVLTVSAMAGKPPLLFIGDPTYFYYYGSNAPSSIGIGQYAYVWVGPSTFASLAAALTVSLSHVGTSHTTVPATVTIPTGGTFSQFQITGTSAGTDVVVGSAPGYAPATLSITVALGTIGLTVAGATPPSVGATNEVYLCALAPDGDSNWAVASPTTFSLTPSANIKFLTPDGSNTVIASVTIPADQSCTYFLVQGISAGPASIAVSSPNYKSVVTQINVTP
jgi:hypothetical protein